jgi:hypothetical protein
LYFLVGIPAVLLRVILYHVRWYKNPRSRHWRQTGIENRSDRILVAGGLAQLVRR